MATDTTIDPATQTTSTTEGEGKVTYTEAQQAHLQVLIDSAVGRSAKTLRAELEAEKSRHAAELADAKAAPTTSTTEPAVKGNEVEIERVKALHQATLDALNSQLVEARQAGIKAKNEATSVRTEVAITNAASKVPFVDLGVVIKLTKDQVTVDPETGRFTILNDNGQPKLNASFEPMSLDEFYTDFAAKNKYLVRGAVVGGTGSTETAQRQLTANGKFELAEVFGPKSSSQKAAQLMKSDPNEYRRMKVLAQEGGLIAK